MKRSRSNRDYVISLGRAQRSAHVSQSGISALCKALDQEGIPDACCRATQYRYRTEACAEETPFGKVVDIIDVGAVRIAVQSPFAMLHVAVRESPDFASALRDIASRELSVVLYSDGISAADSQSKHDRTKFVAIYWSFAEFGHILSNEELWFVISAPRENILKKIRGLPTFLNMLVSNYFSLDTIMICAWVALSLSPTASRLS